MAKEKGIDIFAGYGMSGTCPILTFTRVGGDQRKQEKGIGIC